MSQPSTSSVKEEDGSPDVIIDAVVSSSGSRTRGHSSCINETNQEQFMHLLQFFTEVQKNSDVRNKIAELFSLNSSSAAAPPPSPAHATTFKRPAETNLTSSPPKLQKPNTNILKEEPTEPIVKPDPESQSELFDQKIRSNISPKEKRTIRLANRYKQKLNKATNKRDKEKYFQQLADLYPANNRRENFADTLLRDMKNGEITGLNMREQCQFCEKPYQQHRSYVRHLLVDHGVQLKIHEFEVPRVSETGADSTEENTHQNVNISQVSKKSRTTETSLCSSINRLLQEVKIAEYITRYTSICNLEHLNNLNKLNDNGLSVLEKFSKNKCTAFIKQHISPYILQNLLENLNNSFFSIFVSKHNIINDRNILGITIKYFIVDSLKFVTYFYRLIEIESDNYADVLIKLMKKDNLKINNLLGVVFVDIDIKPNDFETISKIFHVENPKIVIKRYCFQSFNMILKQVMRNNPEWPDFFEFLIIETYKWFSDVKHQNNYKSVYEVLKQKISHTNGEKLCKLSTDQLIFKLPYVKAIVDMWELLGSHFELVGKQEGSYVAKFLSKMYKANQFKVYFACFHDVLNTVKDVPDYFFNVELFAEPHRHLELLVIHDNIENIQKAYNSIACKTFINSICSEFKKLISENKSDDLQRMPCLPSENVKPQLLLSLFLPDDETRRIFQTINNLENVLTGKMSVDMVEHILRVKYVTDFDIQGIKVFEDTYVLIENDINTLDILPTIN